jgi:RND family efflux transporter MFP subunit
MGYGTLAAVVALAGFLAYEAQRASVAEAAPAQKRPSASASKGVFAEGRIVAAAGAEVTISAEVGGRIVQLLVTERDSVKAGQVLVELSASDRQAELVEARARLSEANVDLAFLQRELARAESLAGRGVVPESQLDRARYDAELVKARTRTLGAGILRLQDVIGKATVSAPQEGVVTVQHADQGEVIAAGAPLLTIVDLSRLRIEVEVGEFDIPRVALGDVALVRAEGYEGQTLRGEVVEVPPWVTSRRLKPLDPGRPTDTRILPVKVSLPGGHPFKLGQRVEVEIGG